MKTTSNNNSNELKNLAVELVNKMQSYYFELCSNTETEVPEEMEDNIVKTKRMLMKSISALNSIKYLLDVIKTKQAKKVHGTEGCKDMYDTLKEI